MCDCYWASCRKCGESLPVHISDYCMAREDIAVFCGRHLPERDCVVYEMVSEARTSVRRMDPGHLRDELPDGWKMGVRYLRRPPSDYGYTAVEPNTGGIHLAELRPRSGARTYFTENHPIPSATEGEAVRGAVAELRDRLKRFGAGTPGLAPLLKKEIRLWSARLEILRRKSRRRR